MYNKLVSAGPLSNKANSRVLLGEVNHFGIRMNKRNRSKRPITAHVNKSGQSNVRVRLASNSILQQNALHRASTRGFMFQKNTYLSQPGKNASSKVFQNLGSNFSMEDRERLENQYASGVLQSNQMGQSSSGMMSE